ncbi:MULTISPECIES: hypothetical protein [Saccharothrix]|nr:hypothetical protein [Saccharothrix sp. CB00851]
MILVGVLVLGAGAALAFLSRKRRSGRG